MINVLDIEICIRMHPEIHVNKLDRSSSAGEKAEIQKTRSEETLSVPFLLDEPDLSSYTPYSEAEYSFAPLYDGNYTRYDYDCSFADRYTLLPPIGTRTDSEQSVQAPVKPSAAQVRYTDTVVVLSYIHRSPACLNMRPGSHRRDSKT